MSDTFINKLPEATLTEIKNEDYTLFDIHDPNKGSFTTKKVTLDTISGKVSSNISGDFNSQLNILQTSINNANQNILKKLDKQGSDFGALEKMSGPLLVDSTLTVTGSSSFNDILNLNTQRIINLATPLSTSDAVTKNYVDNLSNIYVPLTGGSSSQMTGPLFLFNNPTNPSHASNKQYVDNLSTIYIPKSGGISNTMTGFLFLNADPVDLNHASNKKYVDEAILTETGNIKSITDSTYLKKVTDSMDPSSFLTLGGNPISPNHATTKNYVDTIVSSASSVLVTKIYSDAHYLNLSGGSMTGPNPLILNSDPTLISNVRQAATKNYVDSNINRLSGYISLSGGIMTEGYITAPSDNPALPRSLVTKIYVDNTIQATSSVLAKQAYVDTTFLPLTGGTMQGGIVFKNYSEKITAVAGSGNVTLSMSNSNTFTINLMGNITGFTLTDIPLESFTITLVITQKGATPPTPVPGLMIDPPPGGWGPFNITNWTINGVSVRWAFGFSPTITNTINKVDIITLTKVGDIWFGFIGGQNF